MCRDATIYFLNKILDDIHNEMDTEQTKEKSEDFKRRFDYEELNLQEDEIRKDRLKEYIVFFNISYICEYDIFSDINIFYKLLEENFGKELWEDVERFLNAGNLLCDYVLPN